MNTDWSDHGGQEHLAATTFSEEQFTEPATQTLASIRTTTPAVSYLFRQFFAMLRQGLHEPQSHACIYTFASNGVHPSLFITP